MTSKAQHDDNFSLSCEFFPPRTEAGLSNFHQAAQALQQLKPHFFSVTFGAGGSTQEKTFDTVIDIQQQYGIDAAPHLSCVSSNRAAIRQLLNKYRDNGIKRIVALRGDRPSGMGSGAMGELNYANELVEFIRAESGDHFTIEVAAYPEFHPQAKNAKADLAFFKQKVEAGADSAITQYFYNPDGYFRFIDDCQKQGIHIPIVPGIMPITNYAQLMRFSDTCGAEIPRWLRWRLQEWEDDPLSLQQFGIEVISRMCQLLLDNGVAGLHFYSLNRAEPTLSIANALNLL